MIRAAMMASSRARLAGFLPWACDSTTVRRWRLMVGSQWSALFGKPPGCDPWAWVSLHLPLQDPLRVLPARFQELVVFGDAQGRARVALHLKQPTALIGSGIYGRRVVEQLLVERGQLARDGGEQVRLGLRGLDVADVLLQRHGVA